MSLLFVRHAQAESNIDIEHGIVGNIEAPLTKEGIYQAKETALYIARQAIHYSDILYTSPYRRTMETAEIIAEELALDIATDECLIEVQKGDWHGKPVMEVIKIEGRIPHQLKPYYCPPGGENWQDVAERVAAFATDINAQYGSTTTIAVSHNHPIQMGIGSLLRLPIHTWEDRPVAHASVTELCQKEGTWAVNEDRYNIRPYEH